MEEKERSLIDMDYIMVLWKRKKLIFLGTFVCALTAGIISVFLPKTYEATANLEIAKIYGSEESFFVNRYVVAETINSESFLAKIGEELRLPYSAKRMTKRVKAKVIESGGNKQSLINMAVQGRTPKEAVDILNSIATAISNRYKKRFENIMQSYHEYEKDLASKIKWIESDIEEMKKQQKIFLKTDAGVAAPQILLLQAGLEQKQEQLVRFIKELREVRILIIGTTTFKMDPPSLPDKPVKPKIVLNIIIAGAGGFILAIMAVFFMESLSRAQRVFKNRPMSGEITR